MTTHLPFWGNTECRALDLHQAEELAKLADSIAARSDEMADRVGTGVSRASLEVRLEAYRRRAGHAEGVRDVLRWLTGQPPSPMLCNALDLDPEE